MLDKQRLLATLSESVAAYRDSGLDAALIDKCVRTLKVFAQGLLIQMGCKYDDAQWLVDAATQETPAIV